MVEYIYLKSKKCSRMRCLFGVYCRLSSDPQTRVPHVEKTLRQDKLGWRGQPLVLRLWGFMFQLRGSFKVPTHRKTGFRLKKREGVPEMGTKPVKALRGYRPSNHFALRGSNRGTKGSRKNTRGSKRLGALF